MYVIIIGIVLLAAIGTVYVGVSNQNRKGNPEYEKRTKRNWTGLTILYILSVIVVAVFMFVMLE